MLTSLVLAIESKNAGVDVGVIFTEEALAALMDKKFYDMPEGLKKHQKEIAQNAEKMGLGIPKEPGELVKMAAGAGVPMFACPAWAGLLGVAGKIPSEITLWDIPTGLKEIGAAGKVVSPF
jgi:predicted peroxiredoxin